MSLEFHASDVHPCRSSNTLPNEFRNEESARIVTPGRSREDEHVAPTIIKSSNSPVSVLDPFSICSSSPIKPPSHSFKMEIAHPENDESPSSSLASSERSASLVHHAHFEYFSAGAANPLAPMSSWLGETIAYILGCSGSNCAEDDVALIHSEPRTSTTESLLTLSEDATPPSTDAATPPSTDAVSLEEAARGSHSLSDPTAGVGLSTLWQLGAVKGTSRRSYGIGVPRKFRNEPLGTSTETTIRAPTEVAPRQSSHKASTNWILNRWMTDHVPPRDLKSEWISGINQTRLLRNARLSKSHERSCRVVCPSEKNAIWRRRHFVALTPLALGAEEVEACDRPKVVFGQRKTEMALLDSY